MSSYEQILKSIANCRWCSVSYRCAESKKKSEETINHVCIYSQDTYWIWQSDTDNKEDLVSFCEQILAIEKMEIMCYRSKPLLRHLFLHGTTQDHINDVEIMYLLSTPNAGKTNVSLEDIFYSATNSNEWYDDDTDTEKQLKMEAKAIKYTYDVLVQKIQDFDLSYVYYHLELPLLPVVVHMEELGVKIDIKTLDTLTSNLEERIQRLTKEIHGVSGDIFNIGSPKQLADVLYKSLGLPHPKKKKPSTDKSALLFLQEQGHKIASLVLEWRKLDKLCSSFSKKMPGEINLQTKRVHTNYNTLGANTGRLSSDSPNLQNIPIRSKEGEQIRRAFIAEKGYKILKADYSQIELRVLAYLADISSMQDAFRQNQDIHTITACELFKTTSDKINEKMRGIAKSVNFSIIYGITPFGLADRLRISQKQAKEYINNYTDKYDGIKKYATESIEIAKEYKYVSTLYKRRCYIPYIRDRNIAIRSNAERLAINAPIQGTAADIMKKAMIDAHQMLVTEKLRSRIIMQVHDELVLEVHKNEQDHVCKRLKEIMDNVESRILLKADLYIGDNWQDVQPVQFESGS